MFDFKYTPENIAEARRSLCEGLKEKARKGELECTVSFWDVSKAFPGEPHSRSLEIKAINHDALKKWSSENGFEVSFLRENVDPEWVERGMPPLLFRKLMSE